MMLPQRLALIAGFAALVAACGDDGGGGGQPAQPGATPAAAPGAVPGAGSGSSKLIPQVFIEDRVPCKAPETTAKVCDPNKLKPCDATSSGARQYCIATQTKTGIQHLCGPCPERDGIRSPFKDTDFTISAANRDPFTSTVLKPDKDEGSASKPAVTEVCEEKKVIAPNYSFQDLTLRGIVAQGTRRKVLMMDSGGLGHILQLKDCVGKEKAIVKDIGPETITFQISSAGTTKFEDRSVNLHPSRVAQITSNPSSSASADVDRPGNNAPVVAPQTTPGPGPQKERPTVVIPPTRPPTITPNIPPQAPTTLRP